MKAEVAADEATRCGEGPIWDARGKRLLWDDLAAHLVFEHVPAAGRTSVLSRDVMVSAIALDRSGDLVFGGSGGLHLFRAGKVRTLLAEAGGEALAINDMIAGPRGRIYAGTAFWGAAGREKHGKLWLVEGLRARALDEGIELANGLGFSPDDRTLYFTDSTARRIYAYDARPEGDLRNRRVFVQVPAAEGIPDGLTVDHEGFVWSARWYGGQVVRYDPEGKVERRLEIPAVQVSSVAFGGEDLTDLYVTTAGEAWPSEYAPAGFDPRAPNLGGALYRVRLDIQGRAEHVADLSAGSPPG